MLLLVRALQQRDQGENSSSLEDNVVLFLAWLLVTDFANLWTALAFGRSG